MNYLLAILLLCLSSFACAQKITGAGDPWLPFVDPQAADQGIAVAIAREALATQGYVLEFTFVPWVRALDGVKRGAYDVLVSAWFSQERAKYLHYSEPFITNHIKFIKRKDDPFVFQDLKSLAGKRIGVVRSYSYQEAFMAGSGFQRVPAKDFATNARMLVAGHIDLTLEDEIVAQALIRAHEPDLWPKIEFVPTPLSSNPLHLVSSLGNPDHKNIINAFNKGLAEIRANGTFDRILQARGF